MKVSKVKVNKVAEVANMMVANPEATVTDVMKKFKVSKVYGYNLMSQARTKYLNRREAELSKPKHRMQSSEGTIRVPEVGDSVGGLTLTRKWQGDTYLYRWVKDDEVKSGQVEVDAPEADNINPAHYKVGGIETIDFIEAKLTAEEYRGYLRGNVLKYTSRADHKGDRLENLKKAQWYLNREIEKSGK
jgi:hypothetical protein